MRVLILTQGQHTVISDSDYVWASKFKWHAHKSRGTFYALRNFRTSEGKRKTIPLHREILKAPPGSHVDHIDGDGLNNDPANLRLCTLGQNNRNSRKRRDNKSGYKGVSFYRPGGTWQATIQIDSKSQYLGRFESPVEAAQCYDRAAIELHGEFARLNFPL